MGEAAGEPRDVVRQSPWGRRDSLALLVIIVATLALDLFRLSTPPRIVFDEVYYAPDACVFVEGPGGVCHRPSPFADEHPHLGKWLIGAGIELFGYTPFGWRFFPAMIGVAGVAALYVLARRLLGSTVAASAAAVLLASDLLWFVHSRIAMLDVFVATFSLATMLFLVVDRDRERPADVGARERIRDRPWLHAAGLCAGAAVASKWSGVWFALLVPVLSVVWDGAWLRTRGAGRPRRAAIQRAWRPLVAGALVLPALVYVVSFGNRFRGGLLVVPWSRDSWWWDFAARQWMMLRFHLTLPGTAFPLTSPAWSWPLVKRPVTYTLDTTGPRWIEIVAMGDPVVWVPALLAVVWLTIRWLRRRDARAPEGAILAGFAAGYLPWLALTRARSFAFLFYLLPAVPFLLLALVRVGQTIARGRVGRAVVAIYLVGVVALFAWFYPVVAAVPIDPHAWQQRMWFRDCPAWQLTGDPPHLLYKPGAPPPGWCWL
jgi:dolichyl-phosphate-mannose--protein O-mannosyl transferase